MKSLFPMIALLTASPVFAQSVLPDYLHGTWKKENQEIYEHWDKLNSQTLQGFSYKLENGKMEILEYLKIAIKNNRTIYTATVVDQNNGEGIAFKLASADSIFTFKNSDHDFPKEISYRQLSKDAISVRVSDGDKKGFSYRMVKQYTKDSSVSNPNYDKSLAEKLGGDEYGMKKYYLVMLKTGTNTTTDKSLISESFKGHMANINKLVDEGKLIVAGPLGKNEKKLRGIFILDKIESIQELKEYLQNDLAIKNNLLDYEILTWYGSAALPEYLPFSEKIWKLKP